MPEGTFFSRRELEKKVVVQELQDTDILEDIAEKLSISATNSELNAENKVNILNVIKDELAELAEDLESKKPDS